MESHRQIETRRRNSNFFKLYRYQGKRLSLDNVNNCLGALNNIHVSRLVCPYRRMCLLIVSDVGNRSCRTY